MSEAEFWAQVGTCGARLWRLGRLWLGSGAAADGEKPFGAGLPRSALRHQRRRTGVPDGICASPPDLKAWPGWSWTASSAPPPPESLFNISRYAG